MADYDVASTEIGAHAKTLVADTADTVTFANFNSEVEVYSDGAAVLYFTTDGSTPTVGGAGTHFMPASASSRIVRAAEQSDGTTVVKLISAGTPLYSVSKV